MGFAVPIKQVGCFAKDRWCLLFIFSPFYQNVEIIHPIHRRYDKSHASIDVGLCLLECLLNRSGPVSFEEEELNGSELSSTDGGCACGSYIPHNIKSVTCFIGSRNVFSSTKSP